MELKGYWPVEREIGNYIPVGADVRIGQIITAPYTGTVSIFRAPLVTLLDQEGVLQAHIYATTDGLPTGDPLASSTNFIAVNTITYGEQGSYNAVPFSDFNFADYELQQGITYAFVISRTGGDMISEIRWVASVIVDGTYYGHVWQDNDETKDWNNDSNRRHIYQYGITATGFAGDIEGHWNEVGSQLAPAFIDPNDSTEKTGVSDLDGSGKLFPICDDDIAGATAPINGVCVESGGKILPKITI